MLNIRVAIDADVPLLLEFIRGIADYEKLLHEVVATEDSVRESLFGQSAVAEALIAEIEGKPVAVAVYFHNFSTFMGRRGLYLEDLFVKPELRRRGVGEMLLRHLARLAVERGCGRFEWVALDWNKTAIDFYRELGAEVMEEWRLFRISGDNLKKLAKVA